LYTPKVIPTRRSEGDDTTRLAAKKRSSRVPSSVSREPTDCPSIATTKRDTGTWSASFDRFAGELVRRASFSPRALVYVWLARSDSPLWSRASISTSRPVARNRPAFMKYDSPAYSGSTLASPMRSVTV